MYGHFIFLLVGRFLRKETHSLARYSWPKTIG